MHAPLLSVDLALLSRPVLRARLPLLPHWCSQMAYARTERFQKAVDEREKLREYERQCEREQRAKVCAAGHAARSPHLYPQPPL